MKIERSCLDKAVATVTRRGLRRIVCSLCLVAAVVAIVGAVASPPINQASMALSNALPGNIIPVTNTNDSGPGSLRQALVDANDGDTIDATGIAGTILLTSGELQITHNVTINGPGAGNLAVNGNAASRVFENFASTVTIAGLTITNGHPAVPDANGGGIRNRGGLTLSESVVSNSAAQGSLFSVSGGGIFSDGTLTVTNSTISGNWTCCVLGYGGGIYSTGRLNVIDSTISGNSGQRGGGIAGGGLR